MNREIKGGPCRSCESTLFGLRAHFKWHVFLIDAKTHLLTFLLSLTEASFANLLSHTKQIQALTQQSENIHLRHRPFWLVMQLCRTSLALPPSFQLMYLGLGGGVVTYPCLVLWAAIVRIQKDPGIFRLGAFSGQRPHKLQCSGTTPSHAFRVVRNVAPSLQHESIRWFQL